MIIEDYKGFKLRKAGNVLILTSNEFSKAVQVMKSNGIKALEINPNYFNLNSIEFLKDFTFIESLNLLIKVKDVSPINGLLNLKNLSIEHPYKGVVDFLSFPKLEELYLVWSGDNSKSIFKSGSITDLRIDGFPQSEPLDFVSMTQLVSLSLCYSNLINLLCLKSLVNLRKLDLTYSTRLEDISELKYFENLEELRIGYCKKISDFKPIGNLKNLKKLTFNDIGEINNIEFVSSLKHLEQAIFTSNTNVKNGDLSPLYLLHKNYKLKEALFKRRKHYTHKPEDIGYKLPDVVAKIFGKK